MKKNSLVKYIGGQDKFSKKVCPLKKDEIYTVKSTCQGKFGNKWKKAIFLEEVLNDKMAFDISLFVEVQSPMTIDLNEIFQSQKYSILDYLN